MRSDSAFLPGLASITHGGRLPHRAGALLNVPPHLADGETLNLRDYGAKGNGVDDDTPAFVAMFAAAAALRTVGPSGINCIIPQGKFRTTATLRLPLKTRLVGEGQYAAVIACDHNGNGVESVWPVNSSTVAGTGLYHLSLLTRSSNDGKGFYDCGGSGVHLSNVYISGFQHQLVLDQTEISSFEQLCLMNNKHDVASTCIWIVNGRDLNATADYGFSNGLTFRDIQCNADGGTNLRDDGGANHYFDSVNFNAGHRAATFAGVSGLSLINSASEGHTSSTIIFRAVSESGVRVGPCRGVTAFGNTFSDRTPFHIDILEMIGGTFQGNAHAQCTSAAYALSGDGIAQVMIANNSKSVFGKGRTAAPMLAGTAKRLNSNPITQREQTYSLGGALSPGRAVITPATMGFPGGPSAITTSRTLLCVNIDGSNPEYVVPSDATATTFTATLTSAKAANFLIYGAQ